MADISSYLAAIMAAVYGEDVRGSIHDAIEIINDVSEVVLSTGTAITGPTSSSTGYYKDSLYLNTNTFELWKCVGTDSWVSQGVIKGDPGVPGDDGNKWYHGTTISGGAVLPTVYPTSGIANANPNDAYLNSNEGIVYICVTGGDPNTATWKYDMTLSGGGGATVLDDLTDVDIDTTTLAKGQLLEFDDVSGTWKNVSDRSVVRYGGSINFADLVTYSSTYLTADYEDTFFLLRTGGTIGTGEASTYWTSNFHDGDEIPQDSHIAIININRGTLNPPVYKYDDFGGFVDISGKADKTDVALKADKTELDEWITTTPPTQVSSGTFSFSGIDDSNNDGYDPYFGISDSSTNKNPSSKVTALSGTGSTNMSISYSTDADNGTVVKLRRIK